MLVDAEVGFEGLNHLSISALWMDGWMRQCEKINKRKTDKSSGDLDHRVLCVRMVRVEEVCHVQGFKGMFVSFLHCQEHDSPEEKKMRERKRKSQCFPHVADRL